MSNDQPTTWVTPNFKTSITPESLRKLMPDQLVGERKAIEHFYNKFKLKAEEAARRGESFLSLEITSAECGVSNDFDVDVVLRELHDQLKREGFTALKKELSPDGDLGSLQAAWKEQPKLTRKAAEKEQQQLANVTPMGGYQLNPSMMQRLNAQYQAFAAQNAAPQFYFPPQYGSSWPSWDYGGYAAEGFSSPNPNSVEAQQQQQQLQ